MKRFLPGIFRHPGVKEEREMNSSEWIERRLDAIETELKAARERRKAAERACDAASIIEGDPLFERACRTYEHADSEVASLVNERYRLERQLTDAIEARALAFINERLPNVAALLDRADASGNLHEVVATAMAAFAYHEVGSVFAASTREFDA